MKKNSSADTIKSTPSVEYFGSAIKTCLVVVPTSVSAKNFTIKNCSQSIKKKSSESTSKPYGGDISLGNNANEAIYISDDLSREKEMRLEDNKYNPIVKFLSSRKKEGSVST